MDAVRLKLDRLRIELHLEGIWLVVVNAEGHAATGIALTVWIGRFEIDRKIIPTRRSGRQHDIIRPGTADGEGDWFVDHDAVARITDHQTPFCGRLIKAQIIPNE